MYLLDEFIVFCGMVIFALFNLKWRPFVPKGAMWLPIALQFVSVIAAGFILFLMFMAIIPTI